jgi:hypothetical protein
VIGASRTFKDALENPAIFFRLILILEGTPAKDETAQSKG